MTPQPDFESVLEAGRVHFELAPREQYELDLCAPA